MRDTVEIENIGQMRRELGIEDEQLRQEIRRLEVGDLVKITLLSGAGPFGGETVPVRITSVRGRAFQGKLASLPTSRALAGLRLGAPLAFSNDHIHSVLKGHASHDQ